MNTPSDVPAADASPSPYSPWLERFAWAMVVTTFFLLILGGTVTSKDVGLAVPDWPQTFGYNMFLYPPSLWVGGIFWEHTHRLLASLVGMLAIIMAGWALLKPGISLSLRILAVTSLQLVIVQGLMGGLRVTEISTVLGVLHGVLGQLYFCLTIIIALMTSKRWLYRHQVSRKASPTAASQQGLSVRTLAYMVLITLVIQLSLGSVMRHYKAGLAIPDFPTAYGQLVPPLTNEGIRQAMDTNAGGSQQKLVGYFSPFKVSVHYAHRIWAITVVLSIFAAVSALGSRGYLQHQVLLRPTLAVIVLLLFQIILGASVIWSGRHPEVATAHQATGAAILGLCVFITMMLHMLPEPQSTLKTQGSSQADAGTLAAEVRA
jgi:cytochrome c oxidase assembly protein subunit 15